MYTAVIVGVDPDKTNTKHFNLHNISLSPTPNNPEIYNNLLPTFN